MSFEAKQKELERLKHSHQRKANNARDETDFEEEEEEADDLDEIIFLDPPFNPDELGNEATLENALAVIPFHNE